MDERIRRSRRQEQQGASRWGGRVTSGSGNGWAQKNDMFSRNGVQDRALIVGDRVEFKRTDNQKQITLKADDLEALALNAAARGERPVLGFELRGRNYVVLMEPDYQEDRALRESQ